jgi:hypothetical protein
MKFVSFKHYVSNKKYVHSACFPAYKVKEVRNRNGWVLVEIEGYDSTFELAGWFAYYRLTKQLKE